MIKATLVVGTRPQIIKSSPIVHKAFKIDDFSLDIIHTGQHYDYEMSKIFFNELSLPPPIANLNVGSGSHAYQTSEIMLRLEPVLKHEKPDVVIVPGDTNSALAAAIVATKLGYPVAHIEAGARCYDMRMAEEINRRLIDHCSAFLFAVSKHCQENLFKESVPGDVYLSGDTMYDAYLSHIERASTSNVLDKLNIDEDYAVMTLHRAENVDNPVRLKEIMRAINKIDDIKIIFPIHPRTRKRMNEFGIRLNSANILLIKPLSYEDMLGLLLKAKLVITDSGGLQKEAFWSKVPCITLRSATEWIETVEYGVNMLVDPSKLCVKEAIERVLDNYDDIKSRFKNIENPYGDGKAAERILNILTERLSCNKLIS